ncbi:Cullin family-domain-containing protein [Pisolithus microcarpus]|nr:Cullin family-domain-containing protein [Pisolithus microcarpus]
MAEALFSLLSLPAKSKGFTAYQYTVVDEGLASSRPNKTPRLDADSDPGSASRSRDLVKGKSVEKDGPLTVEIHDFVAQALDSLCDNSLARLKFCLRVILTRESRDILPTTYEGVFNDCRVVVCAGVKGAALYNVLVMELDRSCCNLRNELGKAVEDQDSIDWLNRFVQVCAWFEGQVMLIRALLAYLDRAYVLKTPGLLNIHDLAFTSFRRHVLDYTNIIDLIRAGVRDWLSWERNEGTENTRRVYIRDLVTHLVNHGAYSVIFERFVGEQTLAYFSEEAEKKIHQLGFTPERFLEHAARRVAEERERALVVFQPTTVSLVERTARRGLLEGRLDWLASGAIEPLMKARAADQLNTAYTEFTAVEGLNILCREFKIYVQNVAANIIEDTEHEDAMVERLLEFKVFCDGALQTAFVDPQTKQPNREFSYALTDAFAYGFKVRKNKPAELIAKHLDRLMRRGQRDMSDLEFDQLLDSVLGLYRYTDDKDVFRTFYHRALARRLLLERSASDDFEKAMLKKLKEKYDPEFGMGDHMFNDLALSRDLLYEHRSRLPEGSPQRNLSVMVLQRSHWPFASRKKDVDLPLWMQSALAAYVEFYKSKHQGRKLDWDHSIGTATLKSRFSSATKDLTVSLYQAVVLLLFNESVELGYKQIMEATRMDEGELKRTLQSLACANKKVLRKQPVGKDVNETDVFYFNSEFTDPRAKVHINSIQAKETPEESTRTQSHIDSDRKHYLDAAIVRIMKAKKELTYEQLKTQTIEAVKNHFVPEVSVIKLRIAGLVEQEYLRRDEHDMNRYIYVA